MLSDLVVAKIGELGAAKAAKFFEVSEVRVKQWAAGSKPVSLSAAEKVFASQQSPVLESASWEGQQVCICAPFYKSVTPSTVLSLMGLWDRPKMRFILNHGDAFISHSRNTLAKRFLALNIPWSFWIDDDIIAPNGSPTWFNKATGLPLPPQVAGQHSINRLLSHKKTIVGGLYFGRDPAGRPMYNEGFRNTAEGAMARKGWTLPPNQQVKPTKWVATGCLLIHRSVFVDISKKFPELDGKWFSTSEHQLVGNAKRAINELSDMEKDPKDRIASAVHLLASSTDAPIESGEDVIFCRRAAEAGHQPYVDLGLPCGHVGSTVYHGSNTR